MNGDGAHGIHQVRADPGHFAGNAVDIKLPPGFDPKPMLKALGLLSRRSFEAQLARREVLLWMTMTPRRFCRLALGHPIKTWRSFRWVVRLARARKIRAVFTMFEEVPK